MTNFRSDIFCILCFKPADVWLAVTSKAGLWVSHDIICMADPLVFSYYLYSLGSKSVSYSGL